jgi:flagellin
MALSLINNTASLNAQHSLTSTNNMLSKSLQRLSTGLKVNGGADGPAALVISEKQRAQIAGLNTAIDNTNKAVSMVQTAEGGLNEMNSLLTQARSLALDSANAGVNDADSLAANQDQLRNALDTITQIANTTQFGSKKLLDGSAGIAASTTSPGVSVSAGGGTAAAGSYSVDVTAAAVKASVTGTTGIPATQTWIAGGGNAITINNVKIDLNATNASNLGDAINTINKSSSQTGVTASLDSTNGNIVLSANKYGTQGDFTVSFDSAATATNIGFANTSYDTQAAANGETSGVDATADITFNGGTATSYTAQGNVFNAAGLSITLGDDTGTPGQSVMPGTAGTATGPAAAITVTNNTLTFQIGANAGQTASLALSDARATALGQNAQGTSSNYASLNDIDISDPNKAQDAIKVIDKAISDVSNLRGKIGAFQTNTLESNANNLNTTLTNTTAAESVIRDTDFASEIANFTKLQTQMQAGATVLGNANQMTSLVASLLRG